MIELPGSQEIRALPDGGVFEIRPRPVGFQGFRRAGRVGARNVLGVMALTPAAATVAEAICERARQALMDAYPGLDGVAPLVCRHARPRRRVLEAFAAHPGFGGMLTVNVGAEGPTLVGPEEHGRLRRLDVDHAGGRLHAIDQGLAHLEALARRAARDRRETVPLNELVAGFHGGADHPAVALAMQRLTGLGARVVLASKTLEGAAAVTDLVASGATVLAFGAVDGAAFGCRPAPGVKLALSPGLHERMSEDMDVDCATLEAGLPAPMVAEEIVDAVVAAASGAPTRSEASGHPDHDFAPATAR